MRPPSTIGSISIVLRLWAALLIATIGLQAFDGAQALDFDHAPSTQRHGSAFTAANTEVALAARAGETRHVVRQAPAPDPLGPPPELATPMRTSAAAHPIGFSPANPRAPPARDLLVWLPAPRGPPTA